MISSATLFQYISHVTHIHLVNINITPIQIIWDIVDRTPQLEKYEIERIPIGEIQQPISGMYVKSLQFSNTSLHTIGEAALGKLDSLRRLNLSHNQLEDIGFLAAIPNPQVGGGYMEVILLQLLYELVMKYRLIL